jgi:hypothetical protein
MGDISVCRMRCSIMVSVLLQSCNEKGRNQSLAVTLDLAARDRRRRFLRLLDIGGAWLVQPIDAMRISAANHYKSPLVMYQCVSKSPRLCSTRDWRFAYRKTVKAPGKNNRKAPAQRRPVSDGERRLLMLTPGRSRSVLLSRPTLLQRTRVYSTSNRS